MTRPVAEGGLGEEGRAARALLAKRGLTDAVVARARELLEQLRTPEEAPAVDVEALDREVRAKAEHAMWQWYLEWSGIARIAIRDRRALRALGFKPAERKRRRNEE